MNNLSTYCGLVAAKIRVSDKDLPVSNVKNKYHRYSQNFAVSTFARVNNGLRSDIVLLSEHVQN